MNPMRIAAVDYHTGGEPFRIVTDGVGELAGATVPERRLWAREHLDHVRQLLVNEPRGHADMYGCFVTPPDDDGADLGVVFFHNEGYSTACGHGTIALATWAVESGRIPVDDSASVELTIDVPSGRLPVTVSRGDDGRVDSVRFRNVPSFVADQTTVDLGETPVPATIAFGGAFYAIVQAADVGLDIAPYELPEIIHWCRRAKNLLNERVWVHPLRPDLGGIYGVILVEGVDDSGLFVPVPGAVPGTQPLVQRNVTVFADGEVDRSPTGSGTSARLAALHASGAIEQDQPLINLSIIDTVMRGWVSTTTQVGPYPAVVTEVSGSAFATGSHVFTLDDRDPLGTGFQLR